MPLKPQLVLDAGGVLLTNLDSFWKTLAKLAGAPFDELRARYRRETGRDSCFSRWSSWAPRSERTSVVAGAGGLWRVGMGGSAGFRPL